MYMNVDCVLVKYDSLPLLPKCYRNAKNLFFATAFGFSPACRKRQVVLKTQGLI